MDSELWANIRRLREVEKLSKSAIARRLNIHRLTVRRALDSPHGPPRDLPRRPCVPDKLDPFKAYLQERVKAYPELSGAKLFGEIKGRGYTGGLTILREFLGEIRTEKPRAFLRLETRPGEFAQVDWANAGWIAIGNARRKLSAFVMALSYSRMIYLEFTLSQRIEDFMSAHVNAFEYFGGVPDKINYDNLKSVVISRCGSEIRFNSRFMDFAGFYLFDPVPCGVRMAHEKGVVERDIRYIRSSFLAGYQIHSFPELERDSWKWMEEVANVRIHGTLQERPIDRLPAEKPFLHPLPSPEFDCSVIEPVKATKQGLVQFDANRYSVPSSFSGKPLTLKAGKHEIEIYSDERRVAVHGRCYEKHHVIENPEHYKGLLAERKRAQAGKLVQFFLSLAPECGEYLKGLVAGDLHFNSHLEKIEKMVERYGRAEVMSAVLRALKFKAFGADYIQRIIHQSRSERSLSEPHPLVLHKKPEWTNVTVEETDLSLYDELFD